MGSSLRLDKLHVTVKSGTRASDSLYPRCYTLTHSDCTGDLYLTIGPAIEYEQISGLYTKLMRDEVVACWKDKSGMPCLQVHLHVSGGLVIGSAAWRDSIFRHHLRQVLQAFRYGDRALLTASPELDQVPVEVHFHAARAEFNRVENWGQISDYRMAETG